MKSPAPGIPPAGSGAATAFALLFVLLMVGIAALFSVSPERVSDYLSNKPQMLPLAGAVLVLPVIGLGVYLLRYGSRVVANKTFSGAAPGGVPIRLSGASAVRRGRFVQVLAATLLIAALAVPVILWRLAATLTAGGG